MWSRLGRSVVGNLSTVSDSVRGFTTLLLGYYFAQAARDAGKDQTTLEVFLRFEQLTGYARQEKKVPGTFRGIERVQARLAESTKVQLGTGSGREILSNQKIYGLWGLFSVPAKASGLLDTDLTLTAPTREFVEKEYLARLARKGVKADKLLETVTRTTPIQIDGKDAPVVDAIAGLMGPSVNDGERDFYWASLATCEAKDVTSGCQQQLARLLATRRGSDGFGMADLRDTIRRAISIRDHETLVRHLESIEQLELLLVPMDSAFLFLIGRDGDRLDATVDAVRKQWGKSLSWIDVSAIEALETKISAAYRDELAVGKRFTAIARSLRAGDYDEVLQLLLKHNAWVMQSRHGSDPWVRVERGKLDVRYRDENGELPKAAALRDLWQSTYFLNSLDTVVQTLRA